MSFDGKSWVEWLMLGLIGWCERSAQGKFVKQEPLRGYPGAAPATRDQHTSSSTRSTLQIALILYTLCKSQTPLMCASSVSRDFITACRACCTLPRCIPCFTRPFVLQTLTTDNQSPFHQRRHHKAFFRGEDRCTWPGRSYRFGRTGSSASSSSSSSTGAGVRRSVRRVVPGRRFL